MTDSPYNVLFLCTGNSCRSILAECILNGMGEGRFRAFSAGSHPTGQVHPMALDVLHDKGHPPGNPRSKAWDEFAAPDAPKMDFVITVCDQAAGEVCPVWPGQPVSAHLGFPDPAKFEGTESETRAFFTEIYERMHRTLEAFAALPFETCDPAELKRRLAELAGLD